MSVPTDSPDPTTFSQVDLAGASFHRVELSGARFRMVDLTGAVLRDVSLVGATIDGAELDGLLIDGIEVAPLVAAERRRRDPALAWRDASSPEELREAWARIRQGWATTEERAAGLPEDVVARSVEDEWSFVQTLRHLIFVTDAWLGAVRGQQREFHPWGLPFSTFSEFVDEPPTAFGIDETATPPLAEVLEVRRQRSAQVADLLATVTAERLATEVEGPVWEHGEMLSVRQCLRVIFNEECEHRRFAERDLDAAVAEASVA